MLDEALRAKDESGRKTTKRKDDVFNKDEEEEEEGVEIRQDEYTSLLPRGIMVARFVCHLMCAFNKILIYWSLPFTLVP
jgi:hypothetical protein